MAAGSRSRVQVKTQVLGNNGEYWGEPNMCGLVYDSAVSKAGNPAVESQADRSCFPHPHHPITQRYSYPRTYKEGVQRRAIKKSPLNPSLTHTLSHTH